MPPPSPPKPPALTLESLDARLRTLEDDKTERDLNKTKTSDIQAHELDALLQAAVAQVEPRIQDVVRMNAEQLVLARVQDSRGFAAEQERIRRAARDEVIREQKEREDVARAVKDADRRHSLKVWGVVIALITVLVPLAAAAINSQLSHPAALTPAAEHEGKKP